VAEKTGFRHLTGAGSAADLAPATPSRKLELPKTVGR
jgi:hypothetical protein